MSLEDKKRFPNIVEAVIQSRAEIGQVTADTYRSDASAILESVMAELSEVQVVNAMNNQGFKGEAYRTMIKALARIAVERRRARGNS